MHLVGKFRDGRREMDVLGLWLGTHGTGNMSCVCFFFSSQYMDLNSKLKQSVSLISKAHYCLLTDLNFN